MMWKFLKLVILSLTINLWCLVGNAALIEPPLTLQNAIQTAITREPILQQTQASENALKQQTIANGQLPDPKLMLGIANLPTDTFSLTQNDMTMTEMGITQYFPAGHSLAHKSKQTQALAFAEKQRKNEETLALVRDVSNTWLELYYAIQAKNILQKKQELLRNITHATRAQYATEKISQQLVIQAQLELSELEDKILQLQQQIESLRAALSGWIGADANRPLPSKLPEFQTPSLTILQGELLKHPLLKKDNETIQAAKEEMAWNKEQYKPGVEVGAGYGMRQGSQSNGMRRSNFVSVDVTMDLPVFTKNRQDRNLKSSEDKLIAAELDRQIHYRDLSTTLATQYAIEQNLNQRELLYAKNILPKAEQNTKVALLAYQSAAADLTSVLQAKRLVLDLQLEKLRIQIDRKKTQVNINYLRGISP